MLNIYKYIICDKLRNSNKSYFICDLQLQKKIVKKTVGRCYNMINYIKIAIFYNFNVKFIKIVMIDDFLSLNHIAY